MNYIDHLVLIQRSAGIPWVLAFMWMPLDWHQTPSHAAKTPQEWTEECNRKLKASTWPPKYIGSNQIKHQLDVSEQVQSMDPYCGSDLAPTHQGMDT